MFRLFALVSLLSLFPGVQEIAEQLGHLVQTGTPAHSSEDEHHDAHALAHDRAGIAGPGHHADSHEHDGATESHCSATAHSCRCCPSMSLTLNASSPAAGKVTPAPVGGFVAPALDAGVASLLIRPPIV